MSGIGPLLTNPLSILRDPAQYPGLFLALLVVFAFVTLSLIAIARRNSRRLGAGKDKSTPTPDAVRARKILDKILAALSHGGHPKNHRATLEQFATLLESRDVRVDHPALQMAFASYQQIRFGQKSLNAERHKRLLVGLEAAQDLPD